jgi:hypothetical protein
MIFYWQRDGGIEKNPWSVLTIEKNPWSVSKIFVWHSDGEIGGYHLTWRRVWKMRSQRRLVGLGV